MIDALIKTCFCNLKCYGMYAHWEKKRATVRVLGSIKKWTPSDQLSTVFMEFVESSLNQCNYALISYFL